MRRSLEQRFWAKVDRRGQDECWPWVAARNGDGYGVFRGAGGRLVLAHRVALALDGRDPGPMKACHSCDHPPCCNPGHLSVATQKQNLRDMVSRGRHRPFPAGVKLDAGKVAEIRGLAGAVPQREIAARFGVSQSTVSEVIAGKVWADVRPAA